MACCTGKDVSLYDTPENKALFEDECSRCHDLSRVTSKRYDVRKWQETVQRMRDANGARLTDNEAQNITGYLAANYGV